MKTVELIRKIFLRMGIHINELDLNITKQQNAKLYLVHLSLSNHPRILLEDQVNINMLKLILVAPYERLISNSSFSKVYERLFYYYNRILITESKIEEMKIRGLL